MFKREHDPLRITHPLPDRDPQHDPRESPMGSNRGSRIKDYLKLTRFFNMGLTGIAPVLGALSMWDVGHMHVQGLIVLFMIGCLSHIYGFVLNDVIDVRTDELSEELTARPLVCKRISRQNALLIALGALLISWLLVFYFHKDGPSFLMLLLILIFADALATIYNLVSKTSPGMDVFVALAIVFLIIFGAATVSLKLTRLAYIVAVVGGIQVLFMNMINGGLKDIDHDHRAGANTVLVRLGAHVSNGRLFIPAKFKAIAYSIEGCHTTLIFMPLLMGLPYTPWQIGLLSALTLIVFWIIHRLLSLDRFERDKIRRTIGMMVIFMYATAPVMLMSLAPYAILLAFIPPLWFIFANVMLHKTTFTPKTM